MYKKSKYSLSSGYPEEQLQGKLKEQKQKYTSENKDEDEMTGNLHVLKYTNYL